jgi:hypothetical protein
MIAEPEQQQRPQHRMDRPRHERAGDVREHEHWIRNVEGWIGDHAALCVGAALALGVTVGWLIKRRQ